MTTIVKIKADGPSLVISERITDDGRERFENGRDELKPGEEQTFVMHGGQSLRVIELPPEPVAEVGTTEGA